MVMRRTTAEEMMLAQRLARRVNRLVSLLEMNAPDVIIRNEIGLITTALAMIRGKPWHVLWMMQLREWRWSLGAARDRRRYESDGLARLLAFIDSDDADD